MVWREKPIPQKGNAPETGIPRERTVFAAFLYDHRDCLVVFAVLAGCFSVVSYAFWYPFAAIGYALLLGLLLVVCVLTVAYFPYRRRYPSTPFCNPSRPRRFFRAKPLRLLP